MKKLLLIVVLVLALTQWWFKDPTVSVPTSDVSFGYIVKYSGNSSRNDNLPMLVALHDILKRNVEDLTFSKQKDRCSGRLIAAADRHLACTKTEA